MPAPDKVHTDDTTMPVLVYGNGQSKAARMRMYVRDDRRAGSPTRRTDRAFTRKPI